MANCKLCGYEASALVDAHIIPRSFYGPSLTDSRGPMKVYSSVKGTRPKRSRVGEYDGNLLCSDCEASLSVYDDHAYTTLFKTEPTHITRDEGEALAASFDGVDLDRLRVFFVTLMWRMHATDRPMFNNVKLGNLEPGFRAGTQTKDPKAVPEMDVLIQRFDTSNTGILGPTSLSISGVDGYRVGFSGYSCWVKIDQRPFPDPFDEIALSRGGSLHVLLADFLSSPERSAMRRVVLRISA